MKIKLKHINPNPFRHIENYPIQKEKVAALRESIGETGFWDNIVARQNNGSIEIAYGHHRMEALRQEFNGNHEIDLIIRDLDDSHMLKIMARENMEEWGTSAWIEMETVKAVVEAFGEGKIQLQKPSKLGAAAQFRKAPSFAKLEQGESRGDTSRLYNSVTIANFIGWYPDKVKVALRALELIEKGVAKEREFRKATTTEAAQIVTNAETTLAIHSSRPEVAKRKAAEVVKAVSKGFRERKERSSAIAVAKRIREKVDPKSKRLPDVDKFIQRMEFDLALILSPNDPLTKQLAEVLKVIDDVEDDRREQLWIQLTDLSSRAKIFARMVKKGEWMGEKQVRALMLEWRK